MSSVLGICNLHNSPSLDKLTLTRPFGATTFLGRYALMDFPLSNFSNSGINRIYILTDKGTVPLRNHIRSGEVWINNTKTGFLNLHLYENGLINPALNTDINAAFDAFKIDESFKYDYVVVAPAKFTYCFDFRKAIENHIKNKVDLTILTYKVKANDNDFFGCSTLGLSKNGVVTSIKDFEVSKKEQVVSLEAYVFSKKTFVEMMHKGLEISYKSTINSMVNLIIKQKMYKVHAYNVDTLVAPILTFNNYVKYSMSLLDYETRCKLFIEDWPIYTTTHNTPPTLYGEHAEVSNSFISNGSIIKGKVVNSILSRDVIVEEGAVVKNCILFTNTKVGNNILLEHVVTDKNVEISKHKVIKGSKSKIISIGLGENI